MNTKNNQRSKLTKKLLKDAYLQLLHTNNNNKITVKDIREIAEVNRSTFYIYYNEPNDLLIELEESTIKETLDYLSRIKVNRKNVNNSQDGVLSLLTYIKKNQEILYSLLIDNKDQTFRKKFKSISLHAIEDSFPVILKAEEYKATYSFIANGALGIIEDWIENDCETSKKQMSGILYTLSKSCLDCISINKRK